MIKYNLIRLYLIKSFRGRCQALGKPSRGQRTWSNSSNSKKLNIILKSFINEVKRFNKINYKDKNKISLSKNLNVNFFKKKLLLKKKKPKIKMIFTKKKKNLWF